MDKNLDSTQSAKLMNESASPEPPAHEHDEPHDAAVAAPNLAARLENWGSD